MPEKKNFLESMLDTVEGAVDAFDNLPDKHERDSKPRQIIIDVEGGCEICDDVKFIKDEENPGKYVACPFCNDAANPKKLGPAR